MKPAKLIPLPAASASKTALVEEWRPCVQDRCYFVSNLGRIFSACTKRLSVRHGWTNTTPRILSPSINRNGYVQVTLSNGEKRTYNVHSLVAAAFLGERPAGMQVNHKDGFKRNNRADNLEYCTPLENVRHAHAMGLCGKKRMIA